MFEALRALPVAVTASRIAMELLALCDGCHSLALPVSAAGGGHTEELTFTAAELLDNGAGEFFRYVYDGTFHRLGLSAVFIGSVKNFRHSDVAFRRILGTYFLEKDKNYWLRCKDVTEGGDDKKQNEFNQDYLEIVPSSIVNNPAKPEDIY